MDPKSINYNGLKVLQATTKKGLNQSAQVFTEMTGRELIIETPKLQLVPLKSVADIGGGPATVGLGLYLAVTGDIFGHLLLFFTEESGYKLVDYLLEKPPGSTTQFDEMDISALSELANVTGTFFMNHLAEATGLEVYPSTPAVALDMLGAILSGIIADLSTSGEEALVVEAEFIGKDKGIKANFFLLPDEEALNTIQEKLGARA